MRDFPPWNYVLDERGEPQRCEDTLTWARWLESADRHVASTEVGRLWVSTVFLGIDHNFFDEGPPILWETMVFDLQAMKQRFSMPWYRRAWRRVWKELSAREWAIQEIDQNWQVRYSSAEAATLGHWAMVAELKRIFPNDVMRPGDRIAVPAEEPDLELLALAVRRMREVTKRVIEKLLYG